MYVIYVMLLTAISYFFSPFSSSQVWASISLLWKIKLKCDFSRSCKSSGGKIKVPLNDLHPLISSDYKYSFLLLLPSSSFSSSSFFTPPLLFFLAVTFKNISYQSTGSWLSFAHCKLHYAYNNDSWSSTIMYWLSSHLERSGIPHGCQI